MIWKFQLFATASLFLLAASVTSFSYDTFYPEAQATLEEGKPWTESTFKGSDTMAKNVFRAWFPYPAQKIWEILIDTNSWKNLHPDDYTDSRALDQHQFELIKLKKPTHLEGFYELAGGQTFPSFHNRQVGGVWASYVFQSFNFPWPLKNRWVAMKVKNNESNAQKGCYRYDYKMVAGSFRELKGYWELLPIPGKPGWTEFRGEYKADPGIELPKFVVKTAFKTSMRRTVKNNLEVLEKLNSPGKK